MSWTRRALIGGLVTLVASSVASVGPASAERTRVEVRLAAGGNQTIVVWPANGGRTAVDWRGDTALTLGISELGPPPTDAVIVAASAGLKHNVLLANDGTVIGSGLDDYGQIGKLSTVGSKSPNGLGVIAKAKAIAAGGWHTLLLAPDNTVQALGRNSFGELGVNDGTNVETPHPDIVTVPGLSDVVAISAGNGHSAAVRRDGTVWTWGWNLNGQLGRTTNFGINTATPTPAAVPGLTNAVDVAAGATSTLVLRNDGTVWGFGSNYNGELGRPDGNGSLNGSSFPTPQPVPGLSDIVAIRAGGTFTAALRRDGAVLTWGENRFGQLGRPDGVGTLTVYPTPTAVPLQPTAVAIATGDNHLVVALADGTVQGFGMSSFGQIPSPGGPAGIAIPPFSPNATGFTVATSLLPLGSFTKTTLATGQSGSGAALLNLTMTEGVRTGYITADRCSTLTAGPQTRSNGNYARNTNIANLAVVPFDTDGSTCIVNEQPVNLIADLQGAFTPTAPDRFTSLAPSRLIDTRASAKPAANTIVRVNTGQTGATSALVNLTMTEADTAGYLTADRCSTLTAGPQTKSNGNYTPGTNIANLAVVPLDPDGSFCIYTERTAHLLVDLQGTFSPGGADRMTTSSGRVLDTRTSTKPAAGTIVHVTTNQTGATSALVNLTITEADTAGYLTADRCSTLTAGAQTKSNGNYTPGTNIANLAVVPLDPDGSFCIYTERNAHLLVDLQGTFSPGGTFGFQRLDPTRLIDTRTS